MEINDEILNNAKTAARQGKLWTLTNETTKEEFIIIPKFIAKKYGWIDYDTERINCTDNKQTALNTKGLRLG